MKQLTQERLDRIVAGTAARRHIKGAIFHVHQPQTGLTLASAAGDFQPDSPYYIASINKLYIAGLTFRLCRQGKLGLSDRIAEHLPESLVRELLVMEGTDLSGQLTVGHLLSHTSGLPCYLLDKQVSGSRAMDELLQGQDQAWPLERVAEAVKAMKPKFRPGQKGKAYYADTNFRLASGVLQSVTGRSVADLLRELFEELGLRHTYVVGAGGSRPLPPVCVDDHKVLLPVYISSTGHDIVSTAADQQVLLQAFFNGHFHPVERWSELEQWNRIFFPFKYAIGYQQFYMPRIFSPFRPIPSLVGHSGSVGTAAFYIPKKGAYITATINQAKRPQVLFQAMLRVVNELYG